MQNNTCSHTWFLVPGIKRTKARHRVIKGCQSNLTNLNQNIHGFFDAGIIFDLGQNEIIENISCSEFVFLNSSKQMSPLWDSFLHHRFKRRCQKCLLILGVLFRCWDHFWLQGETKFSRKIFCSEFVFINSSKQMSPLWDSFLHHRFKRRCQKCLLILGVLFRCWDHFWLQGETKFSRKIFCSEFVFINSSKQMSPLWDSFLRHRFKKALPEMFVDSWGNFEGFRNKTFGVLFFSWK